jgi:hypothetical protein
MRWRRFGTEAVDDKGGLRSCAIVRKSRGSNRGHKLQEQRYGQDDAAEHGDCLKLRGVVVGSIPVARDNVLAKAIICGSQMCHEANLNIRVSRKEM